MGKNDAAYEAFLADLKTINPQIEEILKDDKVAAKIREGVLARADYSSHMDTLKAERQQFETQVAEARTKIEQWQKWYGDASAEYSSVKDELTKYKEEFGDLSTTDQKRVAQAQGMTVDEFNKRLQDEINKRDLANLKFADDLTDIKMDYRDRFKDKLDTAAVFEIAGKNGLPLDAAYRMYIADRVEDQRKSELESRIKLEREDAVKEYAAKHNLPVVDNNPNVIHVLDVKDAPRNPSDRISAAVSGFMNRNRT